METLVKFRKLITHLRNLIVNSQSHSKVHKYILVRDAVFFVVDFFTGDSIGLRAPIG